MPDPLTFMGGFSDALQWMMFGWIGFVPIWVVAKFSLM